MEDGRNVYISINVSGIFFWSRKCDQYGADIPESSPWLRIDGLAGLKRFFGIRFDGYIQWVYGWVAIGKKDLRGCEAEKALFVALETRGSCRKANELDSVDDLVRVMKHARLTPPEMLVALSEQVERWVTKQQWSLREAKDRCACAERKLKRMNTENDLFKKAIEDHV